MALFFWIATPIVPGHRLPVAYSLFEGAGVERRAANVSFVGIFLGVLVPALLGWAPVPSGSFSDPLDLAGIIYVSFFIVAVLMLVTWAGTLRFWRANRLATATTLELPPSEGLARVTAVARVPDRATDGCGGSEVTESDILARDYRQHSLRLDDTASEALEADSSELREIVPFELEGPGGVVHVDPSEAYLGLWGRTCRERRIEAGDEVTVLGTIRIDSDGRPRMSGADDLLLVTNEAPAELRSRFRRVVFAGGFFGFFCLAVAALSLWWIVF